MSDRNKMKLTSQQIDNMTKEINPHMPQYIVKPPWYLNQTENSLKHQKAQVEVTKTPITNYTTKGISNNVVIKYRKGACENCGSKTHKLKECVERPRKRGARWTGKNFSADEFIYEVPLDYEGKRDRWNGYDPNSFTRLVMEYQRFEEEKKRVKEEELKNISDPKLRDKKMRDEDLEEIVSSEDENLLLNKVGETGIPEEFLNAADNKLNSEDKGENTDQKDNKNHDGTSSNSNSNSNIANTSTTANNTQKITDEDVLAYLGEMKKDTTKKKSLNDIPKDILYQMCTSKSLHVGGDYSKYLLNLALNSAYYDGKSRSMRENPNPGSYDIHTFKGDNYARNTGDTVKLVQLENFIKEANEKNTDLNLNHVAMPSQAELFHKYLYDTKNNFRSNMLKKIISKYGGEEHLDLPEGIKSAIKPSEDDHEDYLNDIQDGTKLMKKSIYPEDIYINNHTSVWGSFYHLKFGWGFKCCLSFDRASWCKGEEGLIDNKKIISNYEGKMKEEKAKEKSKVKEKEENLKRRNQMEERDGVFNEMFEKMENYERTGKLITTKNDISGNSVMLNRKTNRSDN